jgi:hypothetical protein
MLFKFNAKIYKVGINPCVSVPTRFTDKMKPVKGYIPIKGKIESHPFQQTLVPVKGEGYRLYVNGPMLEGANVEVGQTAKFAIQQDTSSKKKPAAPKKFKKALTEHGVESEFKKLIASRQKEILKYLGSLKTDEALTRNILKVINALKKIEAAPLFRLK